MMDQRVCNDAFVLSNERSYIALIRRLQRFKFVFLMGLHCTGKTTFLNLVRPEMGWTNTKWQRQNILTMLSDDGTVDPSFFGAMSSFEQVVLPKMLEKDYNRVYVESWGTTKSQRRMYLNIAKNHPTCCIVFDGPLEQIKQKAQGVNSMNMDKQELNLFIETQKEGATWPNHREGWDAIYYVTHFEGGADYLMRTCYQENT